MPTRPRRRTGALSAVGGTEPALALGDVAARHVRMTVTGVQPFLGDAPSGFVPWAQVRSIEFAPPTTGWISPVVVDTVAPLLVGIFGGGAAADVEETPVFTVRVVGADDAWEWPATLHHLSGYRRRDADTARRVIDRLVDSADARALLRRPTDLLERIARAGRSAGRER